MIKITSHKNREAVFHSLPLITGEVVGILDGEIEVTCGSKGSIFWPVVKGQFKVLVNISPGENTIVFECNSSVLELCMKYEPLHFKRFVRLVYITCSNDDGCFQAPPSENNSPSSACARIALAGQMLQSFTATKLNSHDLGFKTFRLEEVHGQPICHTFKSSLTLEEALKLTENELWNHFALELMKSHLRVADDCKFLAFLSFTRYTNISPTPPQSFKEIKSMTQGYVALATGGLALLGTASLHTWPQSLAEVPWRFGDSRKIDKMLFMDDSGNRGTHWACYSTNLGAAMHELGHVFNLAHTPEGVMSRGFDNMHRFFIVDLFYCNHPFQKKHNPHYQKDVHERENSVSIMKTKQLTWSPDHQESKVTTQLPEISDVSTVPAAKELHSSDSSKAPWRIPDTERTELQTSDGIDGPFWARSSALILCYHKWLNSYENVEDDAIITRTGTVFHSSYGICIVEFRDETGMAFHHVEFLDGGGTPQVDILEVDNNHFHQMKNVTVHVQDSRGNICLHTFAQVSG